MSDRSERDRTWRVQYVLDAAGNPLSSEREEEWLEARRRGITATDARRLLKQNGQPSASRVAVVNSKIDPQRTPMTAAMEYGIEREPRIARWVERELGIRHNTYLCHGLNVHHLATPDGIGDQVICEIKSSTKTWQETRSTYRDQIQWQLHVTGAERCVLVKEDPTTHKIQYGWISRNESRIEALAKAADELLLEIRSRAIDAQRQTTLSAKTAGREDRFMVAFVDDDENAPDTHSLVEDQSFVARNRDKTANFEPAEDKTWTRTESVALLKAYRDGDEISDLARCFNVVLGCVVRELTAWLLVTEGELVDSTARNFGTYWSEADVAKVHKQYLPGESIRPLAEDLGRDQLAIAFRLFQFRLPQVSDRLISRLETR